ncbi:MAG: hypothetical protein ABR520_02785 [Mycobacteriales bacterium]|nr:hypothetical protein [Frankia sp.]
MTNAGARGARVKQAIYLGGAFMISPQMKAAGKELGTRAWQTYMIGRGGALGDVSPDVVAAAMHFFPLEFVRENWSVARQTVTPAQGVARYAQACQEWGRAYLGEAPDLGAVDAALAAVIDAAPPGGKAMFAAWRLVPLPDDVSARVAQRLHVLREHRLGCHSAAVLAVGLSPLEAVIAANDVDNATFFNWPPPYPDRDSVVERHARADQLTDEIASADWAVLTDDEFARVAQLLDGARGAAERALIAAAS